MAKKKDSAAAGHKKTGGSALKRLKSTLKEAGMLGPKKKAPRTAEDRASHAKSRNAAKSNLDSLTSKSNPFEMQFTRQKHQVLGRKVKGAVGKPMAQRKKAEEARRRTIAGELRRGNKESTFVDRRFGEGDAGVSFEDKMLERFMKEKAKGADRGSSLFNLEEEDLTHMGQSLSGMDDFEDAGLELVDSDDDGMIDKDTVRRTHFGGFGDEPDDPNRKKSKNEIMQEVIAKSKFHKLERQKLNEEVQTLAEEVDAELDSIRMLLGSTDEKSKGRGSSLADKVQELKSKDKDVSPWAVAGASSSSSSSTPFGGASDGAFTGANTEPLGNRAGARGPALPSQMDDYDRFMKSIRNDQRAAPTDRLKTEEEIAMDEKTKLEKLERERQLRMKGITPGSSEKDKKNKRAPQADDLEDDLQYDAKIPVPADDDDEEGSGDEEEDLRGVNARPLEYKDGVLVNKTIFMRKATKKGDEPIGRQGDDEDEDEEFGDEDDEDEDEDDEEGEDEDEDEDEDEEGEEGEEIDFEDALGGDDEELADEILAAVGKNKRKRSADEEFDEDESVLEGDEDIDGEGDDDGDEEAVFEEVHVDEVEDDEQAEGASTIPVEGDALPYTFKAPETHADFLGYVKGRSAADHATIVHRIRVLYHLKLGGQNKAKLETLLSVLFQHVDYVAKKAPVEVAVIEALTKHIHELSKQFSVLAGDICRKRILLMHRRAQKTERKELALPWLEDIIFLKLVAKIFSVSDMRHSVGLPAMLVMSELLSLSRVQNGRQALSGLLICQTCLQYIHLSKRFIPDALYFLETLLQRSMSADKNDALSVTDFSANMGAFNLGQLLVRKDKAASVAANRAFDSPEFRLALCVALVETVGRYARLYMSTGAFIELFTPILALIEKIPIDLMDETAATSVKTALELVRGLISSSSLKRRHLQLQKRKPVAIATYVPKFQEQYVHFSFGAMRELRKDSKFIARERLEERIKESERYKKRMDSIMGSLANQEGAMRGYEKEKGRKKRSRRAMFARQLIRSSVTVAKANSLTATTSTTTNSSRFFATSASNNAPRKRFNGLKWAGRILGAAAIVGAGYVGVEIYASRHPPAQFSWDSSKKTMVILGTGWGSTSLLKELDTENYNVIVISPRAYFLFTPLLPSCTVGTLELRSIMQPIRFLTRFKKREVLYVEGQCTDIDPVGKFVTVEDSSEIVGDVSVQKIPYDYLVVGVGAENATFGIPGVREHACFLKEAWDARKIRTQLMDCLESAAFPGQTESEVQRLLHMVVVGGGPTGVEYAAELHDFLHEDLLRWYPQIAGKVKITLIEALPHVLPMFSKELID
ncbi:NADH:ubiquinone oxidoreductase [Blyttiomyces sp. JEL0837]|nr:NADH:ubiquinone oxidoreductase [Blyttiomyces sp. JEL0837]